jgi:hypothetical protein
VQYILTFWDHKEAKEHKAVAMCSSEVVVYVANRKVNGPILIMSSSHRYSGLVATKDDRTEDSAVGTWIFSNDILQP